MSSQLPGEAPRELDRELADLEAARLQVGPAVACDSSGSSEGPVSLAESVSLSEYLTVRKPAHEAPDYHLKDELDPSTGSSRLSDLSASESSMARQPAAAAAAAAAVVSGQQAGPAHAAAAAAAATTARSLSTRASPGTRDESSEEPPDELLPPERTPRPGLGAEPRRRAGAQAWRPAERNEQQQAEWLDSVLLFGERFPKVVSPRTHYVDQLFSLHKFQHAAVLKRKQGAHSAPASVAMRIRVGRVGCMQWHNELQVYALPNFKHPHILPFLGCDKRLQSVWKSFSADSAARAEQAGGPGPARHQAAAAAAAAAAEQANRQQRPGVYVPKRARKRRHGARLSSTSDSEASDAPLVADDDELDRITSWHEAQAHERAACARPACASSTDLGSSDDVAEPGNSGLDYFDTDQFLKYVRDDTVSDDYDPGLYERPRDSLGRKAMAVKQLIELCNIKPEPVLTLESASFLSATTNQANSAFPTREQRLKVARSVKPIHSIRKDLAELLHGAKHKRRKLSPLKGSVKNLHQLSPNSKRMIAMGDPRLKIEYVILNSYHDCVPLRHYLMDYALEWWQLLKISRGIVSGLHYLHEFGDYQKWDRLRMVDCFIKSSNYNLEKCTFDGSCRIEMKPPLKCSIVHRDLTTFNLVLKPDFTPCIWNFGLAHVSHPFQPDNHEHYLDWPLTKLLEDNAYAAPELMSGKTHLSQQALKACDLYSLGIIFWEMMTRCHMPHLDDGSKKEHHERNCPDIYRAPWEYEFKTMRPTANQLRLAVVYQRARPQFRRAWLIGRKTNNYAQLARELWDKDFEARPSLRTVAARLNSITSRMFDRRCRFLPRQDPPYNPYLGGPRNYIWQTPISRVLPDTNIFIEKLELTGEQLRERPMPLGDRIRYPLL